MPTPVSTIEIGVGIHIYIVLTQSSVI